MQTQSFSSRDRSVLNSHFLKLETLGRIHWFQRGLTATAYVHMLEPHGPAWGCPSFSARTSRDIGKGTACHAVMWYCTYFDTTLRITGCWLFPCPWNGRMVWKLKRIKNNWARKSFMFMVSGMLLQVSFEHLVLTTIAERRCQLFSRAVVKLKMTFPRCFPPSLPSWRGNTDNTKGVYRDLEGSSQGQGGPTGFLLILQGRGGQKSWLIFRDHRHEAQESSIPMSRKLDKNARRPLWRNREECRDIMWASRGEAGKAIDQMELHLARDVKDNKKGFCK